MKRKIIKFLRLRLGAEETFFLSPEEGLCKVCSSSSGQMLASQRCPSQIKNVGNDLVILSCLLCQSDC